MKNSAVSVGSALALSRALVFSNCVSLTNIRSSRVELEYEGGMWGFLFLIKKKKTGFVL